jgi:hypothetical protein
MAEPQNNVNLDFFRAKEPLNKINGQINGNNLDFFRAKEPFLTINANPPTTTTRRRLIIIN